MDVPKYSAIIVEEKKKEREARQVQTARKEADEKKLASLVCFQCVPCQGPNPIQLVVFVESNAEKARKDKQRPGHTHAHTERRDEREKSSDTYNHAGKFTSTSIYTYIKVLVGRDDNKSNATTTSGTPQGRNKGSKGKPRGPSPRAQPFLGFFPFLSLSLCIAVP